MNYIVIRFGPFGFYDPTPPVITFLESESCPEPDTENTLVYELVDSSGANSTFLRGILEGHWIREYGNRPHDIRITENAT